MPEQAVTIVGAGLAGCEAAWQLLKRNIPVKMIEMRPEEKPAAFTSGDFAELVCSNSLRFNSLENAAGILKEEMRHLDSLIMQAAEQNQVPAGSALAVDRKGFSKTIRESLENHPLFTLETRRVDEIPQGPVIIATGPLTEGHLAKAIQSWSHQDDLHFFDAVAPVIQADSIDMDKAYFKSRYDKGEASYINCAMNQEQYDVFYEELIHARKAPVHGFDEEIDINVFEGCMPVEEMAKRGKETLLFGPLKPVGLEREGEHPVAVVQLRQDDAAKSLYNIVGFQTRLAWPEQKRIFSMIPGLEQAEFERLGVMHRNTYINSPKLLNCFYQSKTNPDLFFAGQITGVEGYVESTASGLAAGINMARRVQGKEMVDFGRHTIIGSQAHYISSANPDHFEPMNANFGLLEPIRAGKKKRKALYGKRALETLDSLIETLDINETKSEHA